MTALSFDGDAQPHPSFFIERVPVDKQLPDRLQAYREMSQNGWSLVVLLDLKDRSTVIALGLHEA